MNSNTGSLMSAGTRFTSVLFTDRHTLIKNNNMNKPRKDKEVTRVCNFFSLLQHVFSPVLLTQRVVEGVGD